MSELLEAWSHLDAPSAGEDGFVRIRLSDPSQPAVYAGRRRSDGREALLLEVETASLPADRDLPRADGLEVLAIPTAPGPGGRTLLYVVLAPAASAQDLATFEKAVTEFTLDNGMHFIILERHNAPVVSFNTYANVGSADDPSGLTGLAHMFEHMAFKGTPQIGSTDYDKEQRALDAVEQAYDALQAERRKGTRAGEERLTELEAEFDQAVEEAAKLANSNEYTRIIEENGGTGLNAGTSLDATVYFNRLPSNRTELWFYLESERFLRPVFRDFYKERDVVREERRMRTESNPLGRMIEAFLAAAYQAHPYGRPGVGWASDINTLSAGDARRFFERYYGPGNLTVGIAGDVDPKQMKQWAEAYFGRLDPLIGRVHELVNSVPDGLHGCLHVGVIFRQRRQRSNLTEVVAHRKRQHEVPIREPLHQSRRAQPVRAMVREVGFAASEQAADGGLEIVVHPKPTHRVVSRGVDPHRRLVGAVTGDPLIHLEQVAVPLPDRLLAKTADRIAEVEVHTAPLAVDLGPYAQAIVRHVQGVP